MNLQFTHEHLDSTVNLPLLVARLAVPVCTPSKARHGRAPVIPMNSDDVRHGTWSSESLKGIS